MILSIQNVVKRYEHHTAVDHVTFDVPRGSVFGLLGPNGAGKTSLIRMITTITAPDEGAILFDGKKINAETPRRIGYMPEERGLYKKMKVGEQLLYLARLKGLSAVEARQALDYWLNKFEIADWWNKKVEELSKGMQQKIQFIATVVHRPPLLILDEPFSGLDPINTALIKDEIRQLNEQGASIIFSTHRMEQVEELCEYIVLMNHGAKILEGRVQDIRRQFRENRFHLLYEGELPSSIGQLYPLTSTKAQTAEIQLTAEEDSNALLRFLLDAGVRIQAFHEIMPSLNDVFIRQVTTGGGVPPVGFENTEHSE